MSQQHQLEGVNMTNLNFPDSSHESLCKNFPNPGIRKFAYATTIQTMLEDTESPLFVICHHGSTIAVVGKNKVSVSNAGWSSRTTIHRIHRILTDNATGYGACIKGGSAKIINMANGELTDMPYGDFVTYPTN